MKLNLIMLAAVMLVSSEPGLARAAAPPDLQTLVDLALAQNPELAALEAQVAALEHETTRAGAWQDPKLVIAYQNVPVESLQLGREPMSMLLVRLEQNVPIFGKTGAREQVVRDQQQARRWQLEEAKSRLREQVKTVYYRLALTRQLEKITRDHVDLVVQLLDAVQIKYEVGKANQQDVLRLQVLRDRLRDDLGDFARSDTSLTAALNAALHRDIETGVPTPEAFVVAAAKLSAAELAQIARRERPALKELQASEQMYRSAAELATFEAVPDPTLFAAYGIRNELPDGSPGRDLVTFGIGLPLPVFYGSRYGAQASASIEKARATGAQHAALVDRILSGIADSLSVWQRNVQKVQTYRESLVPDAHRTLDATFAGYQVDRANFVSLFDAELELLNFERTIRIATAGALVAQARIEALIGKELP